MLLDEPASNKQRLLIKFAAEAAMNVIEQWLSCIGVKAAAMLLVYPTMPSQE